MSVIKKEKFVQPYTHLAEIYDDVMDHVDYEKWAHYIDKIARSYNLERSDMLDISCGTGSLCFYLEQLGYNAFGSDSAVLMLRQARRRARQKECRTHFWCADMVHMSSRKRFNLIVSLYDSMNYLLHDEEWLSCFKAVANSLSSTGLFIFDISTIKNSLRYFNAFVHQETIRQGKYKRHSYFDVNTKIQTNLFKLFFHRIPELIFIEEHRQRIRTLKEILRMINQSPLDVLAYYDDFNFQKGSEDSDRIHFILRKTE